MKNKTINLLESVQRNSIANAVDKVAEQFKSEIIEDTFINKTLDKNNRI